MSRPRDIRRIIISLYTGLFPVVSKGRSRLAPQSECRRGMAGVRRDAQHNPPGVRYATLQYTLAKFPKG